MHYYINIQSKANKGNDIVNISHRFTRPFITHMNVVVNKNSDSLITNVKKDNIVKNGNGEEILFEKGYYSLGMIIAMLNTMEYSEFQVTTSTYKFGCIHMNSSCPIDFSQAEDLRDILGLTKNIYSSGSHYGDNIIDVTRNLQVIQVYCSLVKSSELKIANQNNNLLTTLIIEDPEKSFIQKTQDVYLPIINKFDQLYFSYRDLDGNIINLNADISFQITVEDFVKNIYNKDEDINFKSQFSIAQVCNTSKTTVQLDNTISFDRCYISSVSIYTDFKLYNVSEDQTIIINANVDEYSEISIPRGSYTIEEIIALMNTSDAIFELVYSGSNAFKTSVNYFYSIDFSSGREIQQILGFKDTFILNEQVENKMYYLTSSANSLVINIDDTTMMLRIPEGYYTWEQFYHKIGELLDPIVTILDIVDKGNYIQYDSIKPFTFNREYSSIQNYKWTQFFDLDTAFKSNCLEKPDLSFHRRSDYVYMNDDQYVNIEYNLSVNDIRYFMPTTFNITVRDTSSSKSGSYTIEGNYTQIILAQFLTTKVNELYKSLSHTDNLVKLINNNEIVLEENHSTETFTIDQNTIVIKKSDNDYQCSPWAAKDCYSPVESVNLTNDVHYRFKIKTYSWQYRCIPKGKYSVGQLLDYIVKHIQNWINNNTEYNNIINIFTNGKWNKGRRAWGIKFNEILTIEIDYPIIFDINNNPVYSLNDAVMYFIGPFKQDRHGYINNRVYTGVLSTKSIPHIYSDFTYRRIPLNHLDIANRIKDISCGVVTKVVINNYEGNIPYRFYFSKSNSRIYFCDKDKKVYTPLLMRKGYIETIPNISSLFRNLTNYVYLITNKTFLLTYDGEEYTINLNLSYCTQKMIIDKMNKWFEDNNIDLQWTFNDLYYILISDKSVKLNASFNPANKIENVEGGSDNIKLRWRFDDDMYYNTLKDYYSEYPVDITKGYSSIRLYSNIVQSKTEPLLSTIQLDSLYNNYFYRNRMYIPCSSTLDKLTFDFLDENNNELKFNGNIYLLVNFKTI